VAVWSVKFINDLPDSSFLYIKPGGEKDEMGRTVPRTNRMFPYKDANGKVDLPHLRNALARIPQASIAAAIKARLTEKARAILKRTAEAELLSYIWLSEPYERNSELPSNVKGVLPAAVKNKYKKVGENWVLKETDMGIKAYERLEEALVPALLKLLKLEVGVAKQRLAAANVRQPVAPKEEPVAESMQESYPLSAEVLSEVAAFEQGSERVLRGCTFIAAGLNVPQTRRWPPELLEAHLESFQDSLCFIDHPAEGAARSLRSLAGHTRSARFDKATNSVVGDIVLLDNNEAADYVVSLVSNEVIRNSNAVGLSVLWEGGTFEADFEEYGDKTIQVPRKLQGKCEVDFVCHPSAGGRAGLLS